MDALPAFELLRPRNLAEALAARAAHPGSQLIGGGTDLLVNIRRGIVAPPVLIDVNGVAELRHLPRQCASRPARSTERRRDIPRQRKSQIYPSFAPYNLSNRVGFLPM